MRNSEIVVYTTAPTPFQRQRAQWRLAYVMVAFADNTLGYVALATAPMLTTSERMLRDTAEVIVRGMMLTYPMLSLLRLQIVPDSYRDIDGEQRTSLVCLDSLANFERRHAVEYSALYLQFPFLERLVVAYEHIAQHDADECAKFGATIDHIYAATAATIAAQLQEDDS
jgi:hypothetical protein